MDGVIVAVEGPSAAGKTTWCRSHASAVVAEYAPTGNEPDGSDLHAQAAHWVAVNAHRWARARALERQVGLAVCDSDPLKLDYSWCLARIGAASWARFDDELSAVRCAFAADALGFADLVLVSIPPLAALRRQRDADTARRRRSFDLHAQLAEPLRDWYLAVDALDPGRVVWHLPPSGLPPVVPQPRASRSDNALLEELVASLPKPYGDRLPGLRLCCQAGVPRLWSVKCRPQCGRLPSTSRKSYSSARSQDVRTWPLLR